MASRSNAVIAFPNSGLRKALLTTTSALVAVTGLIGAAHAQDTAAQAQAAEPADEITVTGYRASIEESLRQKREANAFVDVITAEDIGKFPDKNVADSLQRVPGVVIERDGGEGARVSIRGLSSDLVLTELNGNFIASTETNEQPSRSFNYVLLPSNMISSVEVFKSAEARIDEGGVGGTVILHTRRPLDMPAWSGFVSAEGTYADTTKKVDPQLSGMISWRNQAETFGLLVGATWQKRTNRSMEASTESWRWWTDDRDTQPATDVNGNTYANDDAIAYWWGGGTTDQSGKHYSGYWVPQSVNFAVHDEERKRLGIQATAQWKPTDNLLLTANYFRFQLDGNYTDHLLKIPEWGYGNFFAGPTFDSSGTIFTGARFQVPSGGCSNDTPPCTMETPQLSGIYSREKSVSNTIDFSAEYTSDTFDARFTAGRTWSDGGPSMLFRMSAKPRFTSATQGVNGNMLSSWNLAGTPTMEFSPNIQDNLMAGIAQIDLGSTDSSWNQSRIAQTYFQADFTKRFDSVLDSIQVGAKYRRGTVHRNTGNTLWYCSGTTERYQNCDSSAGSVAQPEFFLSKPIGNIPGGFDANIFPGINFPAYLSYLDGKYGAPVRREEPNFVFDISEEVWTGYGQVNFKSDRLRGNIGLRVAHTNQSTQSTDRFVRWLDYYQDGAAGPFGPPALGADGLPIVLPEDQQRQESYELITQDRSFTDFLPSANFSYEVIPNLLFRGAIAKVIARPGYTDLGGQQSLEYRSPEYVADRGQFGEREGWSGNGGNKELKPYSAWQYDLGLEYYFHPGSVVGVSLFRKDVSNFVVPLIIDQQRTLDGQMVTVQPFQTRANGSDAVSQGVEVYAQHTLDFGLGFQANFTYNDTSTTDISLDGQKVGSVPLIGSAKTQVNASVFYENDLFSVRASYNRRGEVVGAIVSGLNVYSEPYEQIDLNASVNIMKNLVLSGSVINLTKSEQRQHLGNDTKDRFYSNVYSGRRAYVGISYKF